MFEDGVEVIRFPPIKDTGESAKVLKWDKVVFFLIK
jgi:hypothetical protein